MTGRAARSRSRARTVRSKTVFRGAIFDVRRDEVIEPSGVHATREVVVHSGSVVILPVLPDGRIILIRQFRYATGQFLWELVAGRKEPGESPLRAARRELLEETGFCARRCRLFLDVFPTPGYLNERMFVFLAEGLTAGAAQPEEDERITVRAFSASELDTMLRRGRLRDAKSIAGILYYLRFLRRH